MSVLFIEIEIAQIRARVGSQILKLASPVLKRLVASNFQESQKLKSAGYVEIPLPDDNADAFVILLNIMRYRFKDVPRTVTIHQLCELGVLVDKYDLLILTEHYREGWMASVPVPEVSEHPLTRLIISYVFNDRLEFQKITETLQREGDNIIDKTMGLPLPERLTTTHKANFLYRRY